MAKVQAEAWGADYIVKRAFSVEPNAVIPITVGKGGLGQDANNDPEIEATDGGTTIIGNLITISGGFKGGDNTRIHKGTKGGEDTVFAIAGLQGTSSGGSSGSTGGQGEVRALEMVEMVVPMASIPLVRMLPTEEQVPAAVVVRSV